MDRESSYSTHNKSIGYLSFFLPWFSPPFFHVYISLRKSSDFWKTQYTWPVNIEKKFLKSSLKSFLPAISILVSRKTLEEAELESTISALLLLVLVVASEVTTGTVEATAELAVVVDTVTAAAEAATVGRGWGCCCFLEDEGLLDPQEEAVEELLDNVAAAGGGGGPDDFSILFSIADGLRGSRVE